MPAIYLPQPIGIAQPFSTTFPATENPILQDGGWVRGGSEGLDWTDPQTTGGSPGIIWPTMTAKTGGHFVDSIAHRTGYNPDHYCRAVVAGTGNSFLETELLLRFKITPHNARGYEVDFTPGLPAVRLVRWNGPLDSFSVMASAAGTYANGDVYEAWIQGPLISVAINGSLIFNAFDVQAWAVANSGSYWNDGNPGPGFWNETGVSNNTYAYSSWSCRNYP